MKINDEKLDSIYGGASTLTTGFVNAITNIIKLLLDAGRGVGESIRRLQEGDICPL